jgi:hypothetical protein
MWKRACKRAVLSIGPLLGNLEGFIYWDFWEKKRMHISIPLCWTQKKLNVKSGGHLEQGFTEVIGTLRAETQMLISTQFIE